jgi:hypothetical protein
VEEWFKVRPPAHQMRMLQAFLNDDKVGKNVKVIWYELGEDDDAIAAFTRLNVGLMSYEGAGTRYGPGEFG